jgi:hypothetical protein
MARRGMHGGHSADRKDREVGYAAAPRTRHPSRTDRGAALIKASLWPEGFTNGWEALGEGVSPMGIVSHI